MSILLEALRKSEKNQKPPEAPNIHADDQAGQTSDSIPTGPLALLLVIALFVSGWFIWNQYRVPAGQYEPPVTLASEEKNPAPTELAGREPDNGKITQNAPVNVSGKQKSAAPKVADNTAGRPRTPVERFQKAITNDIERGSVAASKPEAPAKNRPDRKTDAGQTATAGTSSVQRDEVSSQEYRPQEPAPISYWELPDAIRGEVPEIKFSVLVYSIDPADRFVLINGQRLVEGDSLMSGPVVKEIRRDGVVFSHRLYQFLVER